MSLINITLPERFLERVVSAIEKLADAYAYANEEAIREARAREQIAKASLARIHTGDSVYYQDDRAVYEQEQKEKRKQEQIFGVKA